MLLRPSHDGHSESVHACFTWKGLRVRVKGFRVKGLGFAVWGLGFGV